MKTHYLMAPKQSACGLHKPRRATKRIEAVDCPSCIGWMNKNLAIRAEQVTSKPADTGGNK